MAVKGTLYRKMQQRGVRYQTLQDEFFIARITFEFMEVFDI